MKFEVPITWSEQGMVTVIASSVQQAIEAVEDGTGFSELPEPVSSKRTVAVLRDPPVKALDADGKPQATEMYICPYCVSAETTQKEVNQLDTSIYHEMRCGSCGSEWTETFEFERRLTEDSEGNVDEIPMLRNPDDEH